MRKRITVKDRTVLAIKVHQWLKGWDKVIFDEKQHRRKPEPHFYLFTLSAVDLKALSGIYRRTTEDGLSRESDLNIQRRHNPQRSMEISRFIQDGYPLSDISTTRRKSGKYEDLRKPGWLPTAIVINILTSKDERQGKHVDPEDLIQVIDNDDTTAQIIMPEFFSGKDWIPKPRHPIEVIDGQHRLWAFEEGGIDPNFELPVVAFHGLDISWQAYLFWTINIKPKRINTSLAFDLYPLLRTEDWLERFGSLKVYREVRAQEITEALWSNPKSSWYHRIDMLGEHRQTMVSQAAWINSLMASFIKPWEGRGMRGIGGLFGAPVGKDQLVLPWTRTQQSAFIIFIWNFLQNSIENSKEEWAVALRNSEQIQLFEDEDIDPAFAGSSSLFNTDQGVRGVMFIFNDIFFIKSEMDELRLHEWQFESTDDTETESSSITESLISEALISLEENDEIRNLVVSIADVLSSFDWRSASAESLNDEEKTAKLAFRGSGGYRELRRQLLNYIRVERKDLRSTTKIIMNKLGYK